jgi:hypothetical protein
MDSWNTEAKVKDETADKNYERGKSVAELEQELKDEYNARYLIRRAKEKPNEP